MAASPFSCLRPRFMPSSRLFVGVEQHCPWKVLMAWGEVFGLEVGERVEWGGAFGKGRWLGLRFMPRTAGDTPAPPKSGEITSPAVTD
jgi:hypothetical protein